MSKVTQRRAIGLFFALVLAGCGAGSGASPGENEDPSAMGGAPPTSDVTLEFEDAKGLTLRPREARSIELRVTPRGAHTVRFSLLAAAPNDPLPDAALDRNEVVSQANGVANVTIVAPSTPASLFLRAQVGSALASLPITVSTAAVATLEVRPLYTGTRKVAEWIASAHVGVRCNELSTSFPEDGPFVARAPFGARLQLLDVPTAPVLSVVLRAGRFISGCATVDGVETEARTSVSVSVSDQALDLARTRLDVLLGLPESDAAFEAELEAQRGLCMDAMRDHAEDDVVALLDAMQSEAPPGIGTAFVNARASDDFDSVLAGGLERGAPTRMLDAIERWSSIGTKLLLSSRAMEGRLTSADPLGKTPAFELLRLAELLPQRMAASFTPVTWSVDPSDTLVLSGRLSFSGSLLFTSLVEAPALAETGETETSSALAKVIDCAKVADLLSAGVSPDGATFAVECGLRCVEGLCQSAVWAMWQRARDASGSIQHELVVRAAGRVAVGEAAEVVGVEGSWLGKLSGSLPRADSGGIFRGFVSR